MKYNKSRKILAALLAVMMVLLSSAAVFAGEPGFAMTLKDQGKGSAALSVASAESFRDLTIKVYRGDAVYYLGQGKTDSGGDWSLALALPQGAVYDVDINVDGETQTRKLEMKKDEKPPVPPGENMRVSFRLIGDSHHGSADKHDKYVTWISTRNYTVAKDSPVVDLAKEALDRAGLSYELKYGYGYDENYLSGVESPITGKMLREMDNGRTSGWMYTLNGVHPDYGIAQQKLSDGDRVVFHYIDKKSELEDEPWLSAPDTDPQRLPAAAGGTADSAVTGPALTPVITPDSKGVARAVLTSSDLEPAIEAAKASGSAIIAIAPVVKGEASKVLVEFPRDSAGSIEKNTKADLLVKTGMADILLPNSALGQLKKEEGATVSVSAERKEKGLLSVVIKVGEKIVEKLEPGVDIMVPVKKPTPGTVMILVKGETQTIMRRAMAGKDGISACVEGSADILVKDNSKVFADVAENHWAKDAVDFATARGLFSGTGRNEFSPEDKMTRAMLVKVLWSLAGEPASSGGKASFGDVPAGAWYAGAVAWAADKGIVSGTGKGFEPDSQVTREQMASILFRFAMEMKLDAMADKEAERKSKEAVREFKDAQQISPWALDAVSWAVDAGLISGKGDKRLDPLGMASRAEVASILYHFAQKVY